MSESHRVLAAAMSYSISNLRRSMIDTIWVLVEWDAKYEETRVPDGERREKRNDKDTNPSAADRP